MLESPSNKLNFLISLVYANDMMKTKVKEVADRADFWIDSGAFTAWKKGTEISVEEWEASLETLPIRPERYFTLDVIGNPERTLQNYKQIRSMGYDPIPIFTRGDDPKMLDYYFDQTELVGVGGVARGQPSDRRYIKWLMPYIDERPVHLLGFAAREFIGYYKPYSVDTSTWASGFMFGSLRIYLGKGRWVTINREKYKKRPTKEVLDAISWYDEDPHKLRNRIEWVNTSRGKHMIERLSCKSWVRYVLEVREKLGTKVCLVTVDHTDIDRLMAAAEYLENRKCSNPVC